MSNERHHWRINKVPDVLEICVLCRLERVCNAFDHDLRGHLCAEDLEFSRNAEDALKGARIVVEPVASILDL